MGVTAGIVEFAGLNEAKQEGPSLVSLMKARLRRRISGLTVDAVLGDPDSARPVGAGVLPGERSADSMPAGSRHCLR